PLRQHLTITPPASPPSQIRRNRHNHPLLRSVATTTTPSQIRRNHHTPSSPPSQICHNHHTKKM
ncbi:hypothetical protein A2U01_0104017, partial [Trifolium medium]|nr:hypothetical protein [Trifolium medium]